MTLLRDGPRASASSLFQSQHFYNNRLIAQLSQKPAYAITLKQMMAFGKDVDAQRLIASGNFVRDANPCIDLAAS